MKKKENSKTVFELEKKDCAIILKQDKTFELILPLADENSDEIVPKEDLENLMFILSLAELCKGNNKDFEKAIQEESDKLFKLLS